MMLDELHASRFVEYVNTHFQVLDDLSVPFTLRLMDVSERARTHHQEIFTLLFHGPDRYFMPQGIHRLKHESLGEMDLFLVPIGQDLDGFQYEAVFNRLT